MKTLSSQLSPHFDPGVRARGRTVQAVDLVEIIDGSDAHVVARVSGSRVYDVALDFNLDSGELALCCDCPYYEREGFCKHLWATILEADLFGYLLDALEPQALRVIEFDPNDDDVDDEWPVSGEDRRPSRAGRRRLPPPLRWQQQIAKVVSGAATLASDSNQAWPPGREIVYIIDSDRSASERCLVVELNTRERKKNGDWAKPKRRAIPRAAIADLPDPADREIVALLAGARDRYGSYFSYQPLESVQNVSAPLSEMVVPLMCRSGRCMLRPDDSGGEWETLEWDEGEPWRFSLELLRREENWALEGAFLRDEERIAVSEPTLVVPDGLLFRGGKAARHDGREVFHWIQHLRNGAAIEAPPGDEQKLLAEILRSPRAPSILVPEELRFEEVRVAPRPCLRVTEQPKTYWGPKRLVAELSFDYDGEIFSDRDDRRGAFQEGRKRYLVRDRAAEAREEVLLQTLGFRRPAPRYGRELEGFELAPKKLGGAVRRLLSAGWNVEAEGKAFRRASDFEIQVTSGIDWFELRGEVQYEGASASLPELLAALERGEETVKLDDGSYGILPEKWLAQVGLLAGAGKREKDHVRFARNQVCLIDALLAERESASFDEGFRRAREELARFKGVEAAEQPSSFEGELRGYQREGVGWMQFLERFGFGGCLADDMGVGKTVQVLALLEGRRLLRCGAKGAKGARKNGAGKANSKAAPPRPSLVVVPKSIIFNWMQEAARFTPKLRVLDYTGVDRRGACFEDYDLVLTTYGTLRSDAALHTETAFDYVILDEAQAIKNPRTKTAKAARLIQAHQRLALTGTPVENHIGELWSLFEFLNPGMLGASSALKMFGGKGRDLDEDSRRALGRALRPFILRRTKQQVTPELPEKLEQTLYCEMEPAQRKLYDELRGFYRDSLLKRIDSDGLAKSKMHVLEALLRLRQAACHPGLIDKKRSDRPSAKLDVLLPQISEVLEEGHKALVFSQFTSLLRIVRDRLDGEGIVYEYLDGRTRDRQAPVERFQNDPDCKLFLISLKAGGLGLNLTAAEYVFLLDPWWNPAVEAQAIDRAHRIGQTRRVFAYRLITRDTVEEKVLELQEKKRDLADAIISADNSLIRKLGREDLELLLS